MEVKLRLIEAKQTASLRHRVLRPHQNIEEMAYPNDLVDGAAHIGAFQQEKLIGIVSIYPETQEGDTNQRQQWRLRGMATDPEARGLGVGKLLVQESLRVAKERGGQNLWCNARTTACGFYEKVGFQKLGQEFVIDGIGPHFVMNIDL